MHEVRSIAKVHLNGDLVLSANVDMFASAEKWFKSHHVLSSLLMNIGQNYFPHTELEQKLQVV